MFLRSYNRSSLSPAAILKSLIKVIILITCFGALKKSNKYGMNYLSAKFGTFRQMWTIKSILIPKGPDYHAIKYNRREIWMPLAGRFDVTWQEFRFRSLIVWLASPAVPAVLCPMESHIVQSNRSTINIAIKRDRLPLHDDWGGDTIYWLLTH